MNGKLPGETADLGAWVRGVGAVPRALLPPLNDISPFEVAVPEYGLGAAAASLDRPQGARSEEPEQDGAPDLLVLGFQELDLSTGALLYTTETTREDAWTRAVLRALAPSGVSYAKVRARLPRSASVMS